VQELGRLDVCVANAGFSVMGPIAKLSAEDWRRQLDTNVVGAAITAKHAIPHLEKTADASLVIASQRSRHAEVRRVQREQGCAACDRQTLSMGPTAAASPAR
jgi:NAD(P)-dependent dehydrogenase (short-subunit alcohol dehydrogenase family)